MPNSSILSLPVWIWLSLPKASVMKCTINPILLYFIWCRQHIWILHKCTWNIWNSPITFKTPQSGQNNLSNLLNRHNLLAAKQFLNIDINFRQHLEEHMHAAAVSQAINSISINSVPQWFQDTNGFAAFEGEIHQVGLKLDILELAGWKMDTDWVHVFPIKHGDIPASYVRNYQRVYSVHT